jgi:hypothetical protein
MTQFRLCQGRGAEFTARCRRRQRLQAGAAAGCSSAGSRFAGVLCALCLPSFRACVQYSRADLAFLAGIAAALLFASLVVSVVQVSRTLAT